jgi:hypothetical protein
MLSQMSHSVIIKNSLDRSLILKEFTPNRVEIRELIPSEIKANSNETFYITLCHYGSCSLSLKYFVGNISPSNIIQFYFSFDGVYEFLICSTITNSTDMI